jgi:hypothetical protein
MWFGFPFGVGVMAESMSINITNCKEQKRDTEESGQQMRKDKKRTSSEGERKLKELRV